MTVRDSRTPYFGERVCVVLGAMPITAQEAQDIESLPHRFLICADAGLENARAYGLRPDLTLGDFDSLEGGEPDVAGEKLTFPVEKDDTDTMLGVKEGLARGYRHFLLYGSLGGRLDHTIANISTLRYLLEYGAHGWLMSEQNCVTMIKDESITFLRDDRYPHLSVFSYDVVAKGVTEVGGKYAPAAHELNNIFPLGVSNSIVGDSATVSVEEGILLIIRAR